MPSGFIRPMMASPLPEGVRLSDYAAGWVAEEKRDGHRLVILVEGGKAYAWSRYEKRRPLPSHIVAAVERPAGRDDRGLFDGFYDGELLSRDGGKSHELSQGSNTGNEILVLFDLLHITVPGHPPGSLLSETYESRRAYLEVALSLLDAEGPVRIAEQLPVDQAVIERLWDEGREGVILKRLTGRYRPGHRSEEWLKVKRLGEADVTITGFEAGENGPCSVALVRDASGAATKVKIPTADMVRKIAASPARWIGTEIEIEFQERTEHSFRHPRWKHRKGSDQ